jgi:hypothetical protein
MMHEAKCKQAEKEAAFVIKRFTKIPDPGWKSHATDILRRVRVKRHVSITLRHIGPFDIE